MPYPSIATVILAILVAGVAAFVDARTGLVPNWLTLPVIGAAPLLHAWAGRGLRPPLAVSGALFAALGSVLLPNTGLFVELLAFAFAAFFVPARLAYHGRLFATLGKTLVTAAN